MPKALRSSTPLRYGAFPDVAPTAAPIVIRPHSGVLGFIEGVSDRWGWDSRTEEVARPPRAV